MDLITAQYWFTNQPKKNPIVLVKKATEMESYIIFVP